jgi:AraC-like DNA-binding protein
MTSQFIHAADLGVLPRNWRMDDHHHPALHELVVVVRGRVDMRLAGEDVSTPAGWAKFHPAGVSHAEWALGPTAPHLLLVAWSDPASDTSAWPASRPDSQGRLALLLRWLIDLHRRNDPTQAGIREAAFTAVLAAYGEALPTAEDPLFAEIRAYIHEHLAEPIYLADLAGAVHLSPFHFARRFRRAAGCSPMTFVRQLRVEQVRTLLLSSALPLRAIAAQTGFRDEFHLGRVFKQMLGQTPGSYRR